MRFWTLLLSFWIIFSPALYSQGESRPNRIGLIDFHSDDLDETLRARLLERMSPRISNGKDFILVARQEINQTLLRPHPKTPEREAFFQEQREQWEKVRELPGRLFEVYLASQFEELSKQAQQAWPLVTRSGRNVDSRFLMEYLSLWASAEWFQGDEESFRELAELLFSLVPQADVSPRFPPEFMASLQRIRSEFKPEIQKLELELEPISAQVFLFDRQLKREDGKLQLPITPRIRDSVPLLIDAQEYLPQSFLVNELPSSVSLESIAPQRRVVGSLFSVLGANSAPFALIEVAESVNADVILLMDIASEAETFYVAKAQWLEVSSGRRTLVVESRSDSLESLVDILASQLELLIRADGRILSPTEAIEEVPLFRTEERKQDSITQKWWFWALVGVGVAGLGAGTYFLVNADSNPQFQVVLD